MDIKSKINKGYNIAELPLRVSYYARVSTEHIEQASSITNQVNYFLKYITNNNNWQFIKGYIDEGISGKSALKRENFMKMVEDGKKGQFDLILTKSVSRFARNTIDSIYYTNLFSDIGIGVYFINDNINTFYPDSEFRLTLMASIAQDELRKLSESVRFGIKQSIDRGIVMGNSNILGYTKSQGKLSINKREALIIKDIFRKFTKNTYTYSSLAKEINNSYNLKLNSTSIKRILTNYKYKGYYCGRKTEVIDYKKGKRKNIPKEEWLIYKDNYNIPPIIEENLWNRANNLIEQRTKKNISKDKYKNKIICSKHGKTITKYKYYKNKCYCYYICPHCFKVSSKLLDKIVKKREIKKVLLYQNEILRIDIFFASYCKFF